MPSDEKASAFLEAINKYAEQQRTEIHAEVEQFKEEELKKAEIEVLTDAYTLIQKEMAQMRKEVATEISHEEMEGKRKLFLQRRQITQEVFERAKEKLLAYTQTDTYPSLLEGYASSIAKTLTKPGTVLLVREADLVYADRIQKAFSLPCEVKEDDSIVIGGIRGSNLEMGLVADETMDSKLEAQYEWFFANSGLTIV